MGETTCKACGARNLPGVPPLVAEFPSGVAGTLLTVHGVAEFPSGVVCVPCARAATPGIPLKAGSDPTGPDADEEEYDAYAALLVLNMYVLRRCRPEDFLMAGQCISVTKNWQQTYKREFAAVTGDAFEGVSSVLPNQDVYDAAIRASAGTRRVAAGPIQLRLVGVNDEWSVYQCGTATLAVSSDDNRTEDVDDLEWAEREAMRIPFGLTTVELERWTDTPGAPAPR